MIALAAHGFVARPALELEDGLLIGKHEEDDGPVVLVGPGQAVCASCGKGWWVELLFRVSERD